MHRHDVPCYRRINQIRQPVIYYKVSLVVRVTQFLNHLRQFSSGCIRETSKELLLFFGTCLEDASQPVL